MMLEYTAQHNVRSHCSWRLLRWYCLVISRCWTISMDPRRHWPSTSWMPSCSTHRFKCSFCWLWARFPNRMIRRKVSYRSWCQVSRILMGEQRMLSASNRTQCSFDKAMIWSLDRSVISQKKYLKSKGLVLQVIWSVLGDIVSFGKTNKVSKLIILRFTL